MTRVILQYEHTMFGMTSKIKERFDPDDMSVGEFMAEYCRICEEYPEYTDIKVVRNYEYEYYDEVGPYSVKYYYWSGIPKA